MAFTLKTKTKPARAHISNYKKALLSVFDKKSTWQYLNQDRKKHAAQHS